MNSLPDLKNQCSTRLTPLLEAILAQPELHNSQLQEAMRYACLQGGKRVRPLLVYASGLALGAELEPLDSPACAVELIHAYSLVHDDMPCMDDDDLRRGQPTCHIAYDQATALLVGDALQSKAFELLSQPSDLALAQQLRMVQTLAQASGSMGMAGGQAMDLGSVGKPLSLEQLDTMHQLKTGALIQASVTLGALAAPQVTEAQLHALSQYAQSLGLAFQIQDDILDATADTQTLGKPQGSDAERDKPTYVSLLGLEAAQVKLHTLQQQCLAHLQDFDQGADPLRELSHYVVNRAN